MHDEQFHYRLIPELARCLRVERFLELGCSAGGVSSEMVKMGIPLVVGVDKNAMPNLSYGCFYLMGTKEFLAGPVKTHAPFDMVFIDADHDAKAVEADFWGVLHYVKNDGIVLLHDTYPAKREFTNANMCGTAWKFISSLKDIDDIGEFCTLPVSPGLTIFRKRKTQVAWESAA